MKIWPRTHNVVDIPACRSITDRNFGNIQSPVIYLTAVGLFVCGEASTPGLVHVRTWRVSETSRRTLPAIAVNS